MNAVADNRPALIEDDIIARLVEYLLGINGWPDYHNAIQGNVIQDLPLNQIISEEQRYPVICVNETANPSTDQDIQVLGDGRAEYTFTPAVQIVGVHERDQARRLRADIMKAIPLRAWPAVRTVTLVDSALAFQPGNSALLVVLVNYQFTYSRVIGHTVT